MRRPVAVPRRRRRDPARRRRARRPSSRSRPARSPRCRSRPESVRGLQLLRDRVGAGRAHADGDRRRRGRAGAARARSRCTRAVERLADRSFHDPEALVTASGPAAPYVDPSGRYARVIVVGRHEYGDEASQALRAAAARDARPRRALPGGRRASTPAARRRRASTTSPARTACSRGSCSARSCSRTSCCCARFRSLVLPLKAVLLNLLSVAAVYGLLVVIFRWGVGADLLGLYRVRPDRGLDPDLPVRDALRALDGLRGLPRHAHARVVGPRARQRARRRARARAHRAHRHRGGADHGRRVLRASSPAASPACRSSASASRSPSSSTRPSCAPDPRARR